MNQVTYQARLAQVRSSLARRVAMAKSMATSLRKIADALSGPWEEHGGQCELSPEEHKAVQTDTSVTLENGALGRLLREISDLRIGEIAILRRIERRAGAEKSTATMKGAFQVPGQSLRHKQ